MAISLNSLAQRCHENSVAHGFYDHVRIPVPDHPGLTVENPSFDAEKRDLMHTEISEMTDASRDGDHDKEGMELIDLLIRALGYGAFKGWDLDALIAAKMAFNENRPHKHGRLR